MDVRESQSMHMIKRYESGAEDHGEVGDAYRIKLLVAGQTRTVSWEKLPKEESASAGNHASVSYYVAGSWNDWSFEKMKSVVPGVFTAEVQLVKPGGDFVIVRNEDWCQVLYPWGEEVAGPDDFLY